MGVMACDRNGREEVMSEYCINGKAYLCSSCAEEFMSVLEKANRNKCTEKYFYKKLNKFLKSKSGEFHVKFCENKTYMNVEKLFANNSKYKK